MKYILIIVIVSLSILYVYIKINNTKTKESFIDKKPKFCKKTKILEEDNLKEYITQLNSLDHNKNILLPKYYIPYNFDDFRNLNIMNNYGIKDKNKRHSFIKNKINRKIIPYNHNTLLKNYDKKIDNSTFLSIKNMYNTDKCVVENINCLSYPLKIIGRWIKDQNKYYYFINWSYPSNCYYKSEFTINFIKSDTCKLDLDLIKKITNSTYKNNKITYLNLVIIQFLKKIR